MDNRLVPTVPTVPTEEPYTPVCGYFEAISRYEKEMEELNKAIETTKPGVSFIIPL